LYSRAGTTYFLYSNFQISTKITIIFYTLYAGKFIQARVRLPTSSFTSTPSDEMMTILSHHGLALLCRCKNVPAILSKTSMTILSNAAAVDNDRNDIILEHV
jgi:hypothetical protein